MLEECPKCRAKRTSKRKLGLKLNGTRVLESGKKVQRYICYGFVGHGCNARNFAETYDYRSKKIYHTHLPAEAIELIISDYFIKKISILKIAKQLACSRNTVSKIIQGEKKLIADKKKKGQLKPQSMWK